MDKIYKAEWLKRLRSGDYKQGIGVLRSRDNNYCCLGVLAEIGVENGVVHENECVSDGCGCHIPLFDDNSSTLSPNFSSIVGIYSADASKLMSMNDGDRIPFTGIADWIEENL